MKQKVKVVQVVLYRMNWTEYRLTEIDDIPDKIEGIYSWQLKPSTSPEMLIKLFSEFNTGRIELSGKLKLNNTLKFDEKYLGYIERKQNEKVIELSTKLDLDFVDEVINRMPLYLYLGRSKNVKSRILKHIDNYNNNTVIPPVPDNLSEDSIAKWFSNSFGSRLAVLNKDKWFLEHELFINVFNNKNLKYDEIKDLEYYLNRLYKPLLGQI